MILQALYEYYQRKAADPESGIAPQGFEWKEIPFVIVIDREGRFVALEDTRSGEGKKLRGRAFLVPQGPTKTSGIRPYLLWDNVEYAVGANPRNRKDVTTRAKAFRELIVQQLPSRESDWRVEALLSFLESSPGATLEERGGEDWQQALASLANVTFRIDGDGFATLPEAFHGLVSLALQRSLTGESRCSVTGMRGAIATTHNLIAGVRGAKTTGAALISFNEPAYRSYGKAQNQNAAVSSAAAFAYTTALSHLLSRKSRNKVQVGDATTVFWSERLNVVEESFVDLFSFPQKDDPDRSVAAVRAVYRSLETGELGANSKTRFYVLGLSPNAARLAVRFWEVGTVEDFAHRLRQHFDDLEIIGAKSQPNTLWRLLCALVRDENAKNLDALPPSLGGDIVRAVLSGTAYPATLLHQAMRRIRTEQNVSCMRAAILKAHLNRFRRTHPTREKEITVALDPDNTNIGYRLGRLFAVLEKIQEDASPRLSATIRDRYYGAASANPVTVFPQLLKLKNHHLKKIGKAAWVRAHERRLTDLFADIPAEMPAHLKMEDQARFAIGYYHQRQALYTRAKNEDSTTETNTTEKEAS